ncbi:hypothetical protein O6H91_19G018100 [Diphasiastrum complanatum]|uniref:Uncharacterized protein n=1 Tax=Diphasiastrum complanatum TaxID=34168 RepID=A0ACC2AT76_DIPCM|nr:hypothetical protein O6H91_19G018100 [Diphasiastrum complanatum]
MKGGRKNLKKAALEGCWQLEEGQLVMKVVDLRGSNLIEVEDSTGQTTLCLLPAKFHKSLWIKKGNYVLVDEGDRQKAVESKSKVTGTISQVLFEDHVRILKKSPLWPSRFGEEITLALPAATSCTDTLATATGADSQILEFSAGGKFESEKSDSDDEYGLPPLHVNSNRTMGMSLCEPSSGSDDESSDSDGRQEPV